ncbi:hypothetical protein B2J93_2512 [Marssonina coronariae]|uniref:tyrosinase n=1 Tax=Diplocarpon coronariae TaxID=2795749 RepID=A0A218ZEU2_9HELO|nr:hypothetical protein B2J93_2512 [Marssonina coronariae]
MLAVVPWSNQKRRAATSVDRTNPHGSRMSFRVHFCSYALGVGPTREIYNSADKAEVFMHQQASPRRENEITFCLAFGALSYHLLATVDILLSMMLPLIVVVWTLLVASLFVDAAPTDSSDSPNPHQRVHKIKGLHTGIKRQAGGSPRPARRNILDLQKDGPAWHVLSFPLMSPAVERLSCLDKVPPSLYIQGLSALQSKNESYFLSYFQIAGIHGREMAPTRAESPYIPWGGAAQAPDAPLTGYCTHNSVLFLPWHRPYLALYEEMIGALVQDIAQTYPAATLSVYQTAADNFRIPYWDWASVPTMPAVVNQPTVQITTPAGVKNVTNPTFRYVFHEFPLNPSYFPSDQTAAGDAWLSKYPYTIRGAQNYGDLSGPGKANAVLQNSNLKSATWYALVKHATFNEFGTTATRGTSIEAPHNQVHGSVGMTGGHMSGLSYSAYDPIFWLHHANVDRLFALWQALNPEAYLTPQLDQSGTFSLAANNVHTASTPLEPFAADGDRPYFTSSSVRQISTFGYTYPEIQDWNQSPAQLKSNVTAAITTLYGPGGSKIKRRAGDAPSTDLLPGQPTREWSVGIRVSKFDLGGERFIIRLFLGAVPQDAGTWATDPGCVGSSPVFPPPAPAAGPLPQVMAYSEVSLVRALHELGETTHDASVMTAYLKEHLNWRAQKFDGTVVPLEHVPSLVITVQDELVTDCGDLTTLPTYGKATAHPGATQGRAGGYAGAA